MEELGVGRRLVFGSNWGDRLVCGGRRGRRWGLRGWESWGPRLRWREHVSQEARGGYWYIAVAQPRQLWANTISHGIVCSDAAYILKVLIESAVVVGADADGVCTCARAVLFDGEANCDEVEALEIMQRFRVQRISLVDCAVPYFR